MKFMFEVVQRRNVWIRLHLFDTLKISDMNSSILFLGKSGYSESIYTLHIGSRLAAIQYIDFRSQ